MSIPPEQELDEVYVAPEEVVQAALKDDISGSGVGQLREHVSSRGNVFRRVLRGFPPSRVELLKVKFKPVAVGVKTQARAYSSIRMAWSARRTTTLLVLGPLSCSLWEVWARAAVATLKE